MSQYLEAERPLLTDGLMIGDETQIVALRVGCTRVGILRTIVDSVCV